MAKRVFVVRPFGTRDGVDFDAVERDLIQGALGRVQTTTLVGSTTIPFIEQGNIREDMFRELVTADLVIADLSIHNANVFYELGIRHAVRPNATFLVRAAKLSAYPFDLQTDRYFTYDATHPAQSIAALAEALDATLTSGRTDSPVYQLLPNLRPPDPIALRVVPRDFGEAVNRAQDAKFQGDLRLLAHETRTFSWASEGLRAVGRAQFLIKATAGATETFEWLRELLMDDVEANQRLATLYQRLARGRPNPDEYLAKSNAAIQRVIESAEPTSWDVAEAYALKARNIKALWLTRFESRTGAEAQIEALRAAELEQALEAYASGFAQDRNHFYSGLNALSMLRIRLDLAAAQSEEWCALFDGDKQAGDALERATVRFSQLAGAVELAIEARQLAFGRQVSPDREAKLWTDISAADLAFLTSSRPKAVAQKYRVALSAAPSFAIDAVRDPITIFQRLDLRREFVGEALAVTGPGQGIVAAEPPGRGRVLLFTGHMVDAENRKEPRFPRTPAAEASARQMIKEAVLEEQQLQGGGLVGIAGGACGGDILFHEVCEELKIPTQLFLAVSKDTFSTNSVQHGGAQWVERFNRLCARVPPRELDETTQVPNWLHGLEDYDIWRRNNLWMLFNALALDLPLTLIALWDQGPADGPGGTRDLVSQVEKRGQKIERLPAEQLKLLAAS